jgi:hypothetical protein
MVVASISACWLSFQLLFDARMSPFPFTRSSIGSRSAFATPALPSDGPIARTSSLAVPLPFVPRPAPMMKPPIITLSPLSTNPRVAMFANLAGSAAARS